MDVLFPYKKISINSKIVIWGADMAGVCFYEQMRSVNHCKVICFLDKKITKNHTGIAVNSPDWLFNNDGYDYILIGSVNLETIKSIANTLVTKYHVAPNKIISDDYEVFVPRCGMASLESPEEIRSMINKMGDFEIVSVKSIEYMIKNILNQKDKYEFIIDVLYECFETADSVKAKVVSAYIILETKNGNAEFFQYFCEKVILPNISTHYILMLRFVLGYLAAQVLRHPEWLYKSYYKSMKKAMIETARCVYSEKTKDVLRINKRFAICLANLHGKAWHIGNIAAGVANRLYDLGFEVGVFVEQHTRYYYNQPFVTDIFSRQQHYSTKTLTENREMFRAGIKIEYSAGNTMVEHMNNHVDNVISFAPEAIIQFCPYQTCAAYVLGDRFPVICFPEMYIGVSSYYHCLVYGDKEGLLEVDRMYPWIENKNQIFEIDFAMIGKESNNIYTRMDKDWEDDEFIVVTVGNRLEYEITKDLIDNVCNLLKRKSRMRWVLVGIKCIDYIHEVYSILEEKGQIRYIEHENDLDALYKIADVYLNPLRLGGGISVAWAMRAGLPVIAADIPSDARHWIGKENVIQGKAEELAKELETLYEDEDYYFDKQTKMLKSAKRHTTENLVEQLLKVAEKAEEIFENTQN